MQPEDVHKALVQTLQLALIKGELSGQPEAFDFNAFKVRKNGQASNSDEA